MTAVIHAEWTKFRTVRGWIIGLLLAAGVTMALGLGPSQSGSCNVSSCAPTLGPGGVAVTDSFYFVRRPLAGNGTITARVTSLTGRLPAFSGHVRTNQATTAGLMPWSKAGIIIKASTRQGSAYAAMMVTGSNGVRLQDDYTGDIAGLAGRVSAASPRWLRLTRHGDTVTGYDSADGTTWDRVGTVRLPALPATVQGGLFATSPQYASPLYGTSGADTAPTQDTAVLDRVGLAGGWAAGPWTGDDIGAPGGPAPGPSSGFRQAAGAFTLTGSGDIAPVVTGATGTGTTIAQTLIGTFAGLIAIVVVAAMFMTAEYRRGLIRTTLMASPHRGRVLAGKAAVIGALTFVTGLASSAVVVVFGQRMLRASGVYIFPVTAVTEVRVIAGTAAVLALAAMLALALGTMLRRSATAVTAAIVVIVLPYMFCVAAPVLPLGAQDWLLRLTPAAAFAVQATLPQYHQVTDIYAAQAGYFPLAPWAGLAVLAAWTAAALALAAWLLRRRDA